MSRGDDELLAVARIQQNAEERIHRRINTGLHSVVIGYGALGALIGLTIWLSAIRFELTREREDREADKIAHAKQRKEDWETYYKEREQLVKTYTENRKEDRKLLNQVYLKMYGVEITFQ